MQTLARFGLRIMALFVPVTIAACYGTPANYRLTTCGTVSDSQTQQGIANIEVTCMLDAVEADKTNTGSDGGFCVYYQEDQPCTSLLVRDIDGAQNGGTYQEQSVPIADPIATVSVALLK